MSKLKDKKKLDLRNRIEDYEYRRGGYNKLNFANIIATNIRERGNIVIANVEIETEDKKEKHHALEYPCVLLGLGPK